MIEPCWHTVNSYIFGKIYGPNLSGHKSGPGSLMTNSYGQFTVWVSVSTVLKARFGLFLSILGIHQSTDIEIEEPYSPAIGWRKRRQRRTLATCPDTSEECSPMEIIGTSGHLLRLTLVPSCRGDRQHFRNKHFTHLDLSPNYLYFSF